MRKYIYTVLCGALVVTLFSACGGGSSSGSSADASAGSSDGVFGNVPGVVAKYIQKQDDFQEEALKKAETITDMEEATKLQKELEALEAESENKIEAAAQGLVGKKIPCGMADSLFYTITSEPVITKAFANGDDAVSMEITFRAAQKEAMEIAKMEYFNYPICYELVDAEGTPLWASGKDIVTRNTQPVKFEAGQDYGQDFVINLSIHKKNVDKLKNAAKMVFISKAEYDEVLKQLK